MEDSQRTKKRRTDQWRPDERQRRESPKPSNKRRKGAGYRPSYGDDVKHPRQDDQYRPSRSNDDHKPRKYDHYSRSQPRETDHYSPSSSYRPRHTEDADSYEARDEPRKKPYNSRAPAQKQHFQPNNHSNKARKTNPSTRISSLRKQLAHTSAATMPANILAEKERELQFLLDEREETQEGGQKASNRGAVERKMLQQYHMVRFFERKKAERNLKRARKELQELIDGDGGTRAVKAKKSEVRHHQCDLLYCLFAPLGEKYIALFAGDGQTQASKARERKNKKDGPSAESLPKDNPHVIRVNQQAEEEAFKPPHWYVVELILKEDQMSQVKDADELVQVPADSKPATSVTLSPDQLQRLEALRDGKGKSGSSSPNSTSALNSGLAMRSKEPVAGSKRKARSWQEETDEPIDPMEADSDSEDGGMRLNGADEDESDDEFFE